jgi:hypothetical protein
MQNADQHGGHVKSVFKFLSNEPLELGIYSFVLRLATCFHAGIFLGLFNPEYGGDMLL